MDEQFQRRKVTEGQMFQYTVQTEGFQQVYLPRIKALLADADKHCHPIANEYKDELVRYYIGYFNGIMDVLKEIEYIQRDHDRALKWLTDNGLRAD